jgi:hypothetical protein
MRTKGKVFCSVALAVLLVGFLPCFAQDGTLAIHATPKQAYVFVDDHAAGEAAHQYPFKAEDFTTLVNRNGIDKEIVQMAAEKKKLENQ